MTLMYCGNLLTSVTNCVKMWTDFYISSIRWFLRSNIFNIVVSSLKLHRLKLCDQKLKVQCYLNFAVAVTWLWLAHIYK